MALDPGGVAIIDGVPSGSGLALAIYNAMAGMSSCASAATQPAWRTTTAEFATVLAAVLVSYITTNAVVTATAHVTTQSLGRLPSSLTAGTPIQAPASQVDVPVTGTIA